MRAGSGPPTKIIRPVGSLQILRIFVPNTITVQVQLEVKNEILLFDVSKKYFDQTNQDKNN